jgi:predicted transcriptional regulator
MVYKVINHQTKEGWRVALQISKGRKWTHIIYYEHPIRVKKILNDTPVIHLEQYDNPKGMKYAVKMVHKMAKDFYRKEKNIPKSVKKVYNNY